MVLPINPDPDHIFVDFGQRVETTKRDRQIGKKRKVFVTARVILHTASMFLASALNRGSHLPEI